MKTLKDLLVIMKEHQVLDNLIQGTWWKNGKGCFYGCPMQTATRAIEKACEEYGMPLWVGYWSEKVFEGLSIKDAKLWPVQLLEAMVSFKGDYEDVRHKLAVKRLTYLSERNTGEAKSAIDGVINYHITGDESVRSAAMSAAWLANSATNSATWSARSAAMSAESVSRSVDSAANSAVASAEAVETSRSAAWQRERDWMLEILEQGK